MLLGYPVARDVYNQASCVLLVDGLTYSVAMYKIYYWNGDSNTYVNGTFSISGAALYIQAKSSKSELNTSYNFEGINCFCMY